jgi:hypothetical protein
MRNRILICCAALAVAMPCQSQSVLKLTVNADLRPLLAAIPIPSGINEHNFPPEDKSFRYDLRLLGAPNYAIEPDGSLSVSARYYGDIQYEKGFISLCHLGSSPGNYDGAKHAWVLLDATVSVKPTAVDENGTLFLKAETVGANFAQGAGSDSHCSILSIDVYDRIKTFLNGPLRNSAVNSLRNIKLAFPISKEQLSAVNAVYAFTLPQYPGSATACVAANAEQIVIGPIKGGAGGQVDTVQLPIELRQSPAISIIPSTAACPKNPSPPRPVTVVVR